MLRVPTVFLILAMGAALSACGKKADSAAAGWDGPFSSPQKPGRYLGVGIYTPSQTWGKLVQAQADSAAGDARLSDDQAIIVVMDSRTGEIRLRRPDRLLRRPEPLGLAPGRQPAYAGDLER